MASIWHKLEKHLPFVNSPSQYIGGEWNAIQKDPSSVDVQVAIAFPDVYKIGMAHLGMQIFYGQLNERSDTLCERVFAPWPDLEAKMREHDIPLFSLDSHRPVREFDILGFSLQSEMQYTNIINMLDLGGIPLYSEERGEDDPLILAGGPNSSYPEPIADFFDVIVIGDGEEALPKITELWKERESRVQILRRIAQEVPGAYVPRFYRFHYGEDGILQEIEATDGAPEKIKKAIVSDFENVYYPMKPVVPYAEVVHDRINLEIMRGCPHRCRFCHAVMFKNKLRFRTVETLLNQAETVYNNTGYESMALTSLSSGDHPHIAELMTRLNARFAPRNVNITLPSLRIDDKLAELPRLMKTVRKGGFTVAPEGGTEMLRKIIRKPIKDVDLYATARSAFEEGWKHLKLYFMIGLPGENSEDLEGIVQTARKVSRVGKEVRGKYADVNVTISPMVPKPHTPFQFAAQKSFQYVQDVEDRLQRMARGSRILLRMHSPKTSYVEAVMARGDRRVGKAVLEAWKLGARFDEWREHFNYDRWMEAFKRADIDPDFYARREPTEGEVLAWDHFDIRQEKATLWKDWEQCRTMARERDEVVPVS